MNWECWINTYVSSYCVPRGLRPNTIAAYSQTLRQFRDYVCFNLDNKGPDQIQTRDILQYVCYLQKDRNNGPSAVNRQVIIIKKFYQACRALGFIDYNADPSANLPKFKVIPQKMPVTLNKEEVKKLIFQPDADTILGIRDRAIMALLYGSAIRASECANIRECDIDFANTTMFVTGKGGHQRVVTFNEKVAAMLINYKNARGPSDPKKQFFRSRKGNGISRNTIYERVRTHSRKARIEKRVSPHTFRHTAATHLIMAGKSLNVVAEVLGHRHVSSTDIYVHLTASDLREAAEHHPVRELVGTVEKIMPGIRLPFQNSKPRKFG